MKWPYVKLKKMLRLEYGKSLPKSKRNNNGRIPVAGSNGSDGFHNEAFVQGPGIVVGRKGSAGRITWYESDFWPIDTTFYVTRRVELDLRWAYYLLNKLRLDRLAIITGVPGLSREVVYNLKAPLPPTSEQQRIVEILDQADRLRKLRADADAKAQRILPALFVKMFGDPVTNPMEWKAGILGDVCERITDGTHQPPPFVENGIPFLFVQNIVKGFINFNTQKFITEEIYESLTRTIAPQKGDILYSTVGSYGVAVVVDTNRLFLFQRHIGHLRPKGALMDSWFLCAQMNTPFVKAQANQRARGLAQKTLNLSEIRQFQVVIPPVVEQKKFRLAMQNLEKITGRVNDQEILIESLFKIILHRAFTGGLTASWREAHMKDLLQEMEIQAKALAS